ncbi:MAG: thioredoxin [Bacteroidia bacterium]
MPKTTFQSLIEGPKPVLIDFHAEWCGPCKSMSPVIKDIAGKYSGKARVIKIDIDKNPEIANQYQVRGVPTFMIFKEGKMVWRESGAIPAGMITKALDQFS